MKYILDIKISAEGGVFHAYDYYEAKQKGLGLSFLEAWENHIELLKETPLMFQKKHKNFRQLLIKPYPYHIIS